MKDSMKKRAVIAILATAGDELPWYDRRRAGEQLPSDRWSDFLDEAQRVIDDTRKACEIVEHGQLPLAGVAARD